MKKNYASRLMRYFLILFLFNQGGKLNSQTVTTFSYTGSMQSFTVPACVGQITVDVRGAKGGTGYNVYSQGGNGGRVQAVIPVTSGQVLQIFVGGAGVNATSA